MNADRQPTHPRTCAPLGAARPPGGAKRAERERERERAHEGGPNQRPEKKAGRGRLHAGLPRQAGESHNDEGDKPETDTLRPE